MWSRELTYSPNLKSRTQTPFQRKEGLSASPSPTFPGAFPESSDSHPSLCLETPVLAVIFATVQCLLTLFHTGPVLLAKQMINFGSQWLWVEFYFRLSLNISGQETGRGKDLEPQPGLPDQGSQSLHPQSVPAWLCKLLSHYLVTAFMLCLPSLVIPFKTCNWAQTLQSIPQSK